MEHSDAQGGILAILNICRSFLVFCFLQIVVPDKRQVSRARLSSKQ